MRETHLPALLGVGLLALVASLALACGSNNKSSNNTTSSVPVPSVVAGGSTPSGSPAAGATGSFSCVSGSITAVGSTALQPLVDAAAKQYQRKCPGAQISVQGGGSGTGLSQVAGGAANIGDSDIFAEERSGINAKTIIDHQVVKQGFVQIVNPGVSGVKSLTQQQSLEIWTGKTKNWKELGGPDQTIVLILRPASSGTRATFDRLVLNGADEAEGKALTQDSNGAVTEAVKGTPGAISVIGFAYLATAGTGVTPLQYEGVDPSVANISNETYKVFSYGHMYTKGQPSGLTAAFLSYMISPEIQGGPVKDLGYAPAPASPAAPPAQ
jgi:phosphate transport system substrate-binding protein